MTKTLFNLGDLSLNELFNLGFDALDPILSFFNEQPDLFKLWLAGVKILTPLLLYSSIIRIYNKTVPKLNPEIVSEQEKLLVQKERLTFMLFAAPLLVFLLLGLELAFSRNLTNPNIEGSINFESNSDISSLSKNKEPDSLSLLGFIRKQKLKWKWLFFFFILGILLKTINLNKFSLLNLISYLEGLLFNVYYIKWYILIMLIISLILVLWYIFILAMIYLFKQNKLKKSILLPSLLLNTMEDLESDSTNKGEYLKILVKYYLLHLYIYTFCILLLAFLYFLN